MTTSAANQLERFYRPCMIFGLLLLAATPLMASDFTMEHLGEVEQKAFVRGHAISPGTKDYPFRLLIGFEGGNGTWIVNLKEGVAQKAEAAGIEDDYLQWPSFIGADGKVFTSCGRGGLSIYDPIVDTIKYVRPIPKARWLRGLAIGPEGHVYVSDYPTGSAAKYNPATGEVTLFGKQGGPFEIPNIYGYSIGCDGRYVYTAAGKIPWYVVAYDTKTGQQKNLLRFESADHPEVHQRDKKVFLEVTVGNPKAGEPAVSRFLLKDGQVEPVESIPRFDDSYVPGDDLPQPEIERWDRHLAVADDGAEVRYRMPNQDWRSVKIPISGQAMTIERIEPLSNGNLLVSTGPYGNIHRYDAKSESFSRIGNPASKNVYDLLQVDQRVFFCGYPNAIFGELGKKEGTLIGDWHASLGSKHALYLVRGADGLIYSGNHNERESTGGALGWYDPKSGEFGGIHFPNDDCEHLTSARNGKYIVYASDFSSDPANPEIQKRNGKLLIYDTSKHEIVREISPLSDGSAGVVVESAPGILFGFGRHDKLPMMYSVVLETGEVQRSPLPGRAPRFIARGPEGNVYFFVNGSLVRANPTSFKIESICPAEPGRMAFLERDLYIAGTTQLRRIAHIVGE